MEVLPIPRPAIQLAILVGMLLAFATTAMAQDRPTMVPEGSSGFLSCQDTPQAWINAETILTQPAWIVAGVLAHEMDHHRIASLFPSCDAFHKWAYTGKNRLYLEASAYCAAAMASRDVFTSREETLRYWSKYLTHPLYQFGLSREDAFSETARLCPSLK